MDIDFKDVLKEKREIVWQEIQKYLKTPQFPGKIAIPPKYQKEMDFHWQMVGDYPRRLGKYLRPTLVLLTAEAFGVPEEKALLTAAAMQISEDWILIHDDFEDNSWERRGQPTLHRLYGPELAVNAGDALQTVMWKMLWDNQAVLGEKKATEVTQEFYQMLTRTIFGQTVEIKWTKDNREDLTDEDIFLILDGKTSYYTIAGPMRLGAIIGGATQNQLESIYEFGQALGRCFQIVDDLLDLTSDFAGLKKQQGNDIYEGKRTIMLMHLFRNIKGTEENRLIKIMKKSREEKTAEEVEWVISQMGKAGSLDYGRKLAEKLAQEAREIFVKKLGFLKNQPARGELEVATNFILKRAY